MRLLVLESRPIQVGAVALNVVILLVRLGADVSDYAALGIFFGFRSRTLIFVLVSFRCAIFIFSILFVWVVSSLCCVSDTEGHLMPALNVLFGNQVVEMNQFTSGALAPFIS
jgi:hypothetical protein